MINMNRMIFVSPPINKKPKVDMSHRIRRIIAIILKIPGNKLIRKRMIIR